MASLTKTKDRVTRPTPVGIAGMLGFLSSSPLRVESNARGKRPPGGGGAGGGKYSTSEPLTVGA